MPPMAVATMVSVDTIFELGVGCCSSSLLRVDEEVFFKCGCVVVYWSFLVLLIRMAGRVDRPDEDNGLNTIQLN